VKRSAAQVTKSPGQFRDSGGLVDRVQRMRIYIPLYLMLLLAALVLGSQGVITSREKWLGILVLAPATSWLAAHCYDWIASAAARGLMGSIFSARGGDPYTRQYSEQEALLVRGEVAQAMDSYRSHLVAFPDDLEARLRLAALYAGPATMVDAAERLYLEVRTRDTRGMHEARISNALMDLYQSSGRRSRLKAELARFARIHHGTVAGRQARDRVRQLAEEDISVD